MTAHIHHTSRKSMATGSAWGRLLTIAFLCLTANLIVFITIAVAIPYNLTVTKTIDGGESGTQSSFVIEVDQPF